MSDKLKVIFTAIFISLFAINIYAASADLSEKYLTKATEAFEQDDIDNAYKYINAALKLQKSDGVNAQVTYLAQTIYSIKLESMLTKYDELVFIDISENLNSYPEIANARIKKLIKQVEASQESKKEVLEQQRFNQQKQMMEMQAGAMEKQAEAMEKNAEIAKQSAEIARQSAENSAKQTEVLSSTMKDMSDAFNKNADETKKSRKLIALSIVGITLLVLIIVIMIILLIRRSMKNQQMAQEQVAQAFRFLAESQNTTNKLMLGGVTDIYGANPTLRIAGSSSTWSGTAALPSLDFSPEDEDEIKKLAVKCEEIGTQIDQVTGRKNNSKNVSEIVYKLSMQLGLSQGMSLLNFCAAMIYDAGFLGLDEELLKTEVLNEEQKKAMKEHVKIAEKYLDFVPKKYWSVFEDAALKHHENMDGSGYPQGLKGEEIPQIARLIRVAETYVSMSSRRQYRETMDKETAINKLKEQPNFYDSEVVDALDQII